MGVFSFARYDDNFYKRSYAGRLKKHLQPRQKDYSVFDGYYTPPITSSLLLRSCKVTKKHLSLVIVGLPVVMICPLVSTCLIKALISIDPCKPSLLCLFLVFIVTLVFLLQTMTHEIGHMFGISHCQWLSCVMQGSNHLDESDRRPLDFCPICLRKLQFAISFNIAERYKVMTHWLLKTRR